MLYEHFAPAMLGICYRYTKSINDAEDVLQDGFVKVFKYLSQYKSDGELGGWIRKIMVNTAIDELRRQNMLPEIGDMPEYLWEQQDTSQSAEQKLFYKELIGQVKKLPPSYRAVFNMYVIDGFTHQEIANQLGISVGTSKSSLSKARVHLQKYISKDSSEQNICRI